ncbi:hypothetical protein ACFWJ4_15420 [Kitasatospora sp. NPDC127067]|uniref:hypothetical protein n=1 Tax=Kitasatospora sp. NPDC127067 TaxID=3347126 RepID=UPI003669B318
MDSLREACARLDLNPAAVHATPAAVRASQQTLKTFPYGWTVLSVVLLFAAVRFFEQFLRTAGDIAVRLGLGPPTGMGHAGAHRLGPLFDPSSPVNGLGIVLSYVYLTAVAVAVGRMMRRHQPEFHYAVTLLAISGIEGCAKARAQAPSERASSLRRLDQVCRNLERALLELHRTARSIHRRSPRRASVREHCALVAGALRVRLARIDADPDTGLVELARMLALIGENFAAGRLAALLPEAELEGVTPVSTRRASVAETVRLALAIAAATASAAAATVLLPSTGLPTAVHSTVVFGSAVVAGMLVAGRSRFARIAEYLPGK